MQHAAQAYKNVAKETASARDLEASLLLKSAARFQAICDGWDRRKVELNDALLFNRKLWTFFLDSVTRDDNPLPIAIRQNVASLGLFVISRTINLTSNPQPDGLGTLININRKIASGLRAQAVKNLSGGVQAGPRKASKLSCASRAVVDSEADSVVCSDKICAPTSVVFTPSIDCSIVVSVFAVCACWSCAALIAFCALARLASISLMFCTPLGTASAAKTRWLSAL